jgi:hypothetical protein
MPTDEPAEPQLPMAADPNILAIKEMAKSLIEPIARAEERRAIEETAQLQAILDLDRFKHSTYAVGVAALLGVALLGWWTNELTIAAILTHFAAVVTGFVAGKGAKSE